MNWISVSLLVILFSCGGLPIGVSYEDNKVVQASEILTKIEQGETVEYDHFIIRGDLSTSGLNSSNMLYPYEPRLNISNNKVVICSLICINNSVVEGAVDFGRVIFLKPVNLRNTKFLNDVNFRAAEFKELADFSESVFNKDADFRLTRFAKGSAFDFSKFEEDADFYESSFNDISRFSGSKFKGYTNFENSKFEGTTYFDRCHFTNAFVDGTCFEGLLYLNKTKYDKFYANWDLIKDLFYDEETYYLLTDNFKKIGRSMDADNCYLKFRRLQLRRDFQEFENRSFEPIDIEKVANLEIRTIQLYAWAYNKKPNAIFWSLLFVAIFGIFWGRMLKASNEFIDEYSSQWDMKNDSGSSRTFINGMIFSFNLFFSGSTLSIIKPPPQPQLPLGSNKWVKHVYNLERLYGTIFTFFISLYITKVLAGI